MGVLWSRILGWLPATSDPPNQESGDPRAGYIARKRRRWLARPSQIEGTSLRELRSFRGYSETTRRAVSLLAALEAAGHTDDVPIMRIIASIEVLSRTGRFETRLRDINKDLAILVRLHGSVNTLRRMMAGDSGPTATEKLNHLLARLDWMTDLERESEAQSGPASPRPFADAILELVAARTGASGMNAATGFMDHVLNLLGPPPESSGMHTDIPTPRLPVGVS